MNKWVFFVLMKRIIRKKKEQGLVTSLSIVANFALYCAYAFHWFPIDWYWVMMPWFIGVAYNLITYIQLLWWCLSYFVNEVSNTYPQINMSDEDFNKEIDSLSNEFDIKEPIDKVLAKKYIDKLEKNLQDIKRA